MDDIIKSVEAVSLDQVQQLAQQLFIRENLSLTILGPLSKDEVPEAVLEI
jgi:predicted Zn-dependent peptidase